MVWGELPIDLTCSSTRETKTFIECPSNSVIQSFLFKLVSRVRDDEKLASSWLARGEGISAAWNVIFQFPIRTLESWLRSRDSFEVQRVKFHIKKNHKTSWKKDLYWLFCVFLAIQIVIVLFLSAHPWNRLHHVLFFNLVQSRVRWSRE